jgi:hypothetical protein
MDENPYKAPQTEPNRPLDKVPRPQDEERDYTIAFLVLSAMPFVFYYLFYW